MTARAGGTANLQWRDVTAKSRPLCVNSFFMNSLYLGVLWLIYYGLHSAMAGRSIKMILQRMLGEKFRYYRSFYSFFAAINFVLLFWLHSILPSPNLFEPGWGARLPAGILILAGVSIATQALRSYPLSFWFLEQEAKKLITTGWYAYVRHPMYFGVLLLLLGYLLWFPSVKNLVFVGISIIYLIVGSLLEEAKLLDRFGEDYLRYRRSVKMLVPYVF